MKARAPGKVVLSGAYSVLHGAPAIVCAVDRYARADTTRAPDWISEEVKAAFNNRSMPHVDASALRKEGRKLGLGSSAAILVAALAAARGRPSETLSSLREQLLSPALEAHRKAQGGGSGVDVATSIWGGTLIARRREKALELEHARLPVHSVIEIWASPHSTATAGMLQAVEKLRHDHSRIHHELFTQLTSDALEAREALISGDLDGLMASLGNQQAGLAQLGEAARVPIVTTEAESLASIARNEGAIVIPAGAGGGDIVLWVARQASSPAFRKLAHRLLHERVDAQLEAEGVHLTPDPVEQP